MRLLLVSHQVLLPLLLVLTASATITTTIATTIMICFIMYAAIAKMVPWKPPSSSTHPLPLCDMTSIGSGGAASSGANISSIDLGEDMSEGSDPAWVLALQQYPAVDQFKVHYTKGRTLSKTDRCKVVWVQARVDGSGSGIPRACKQYERTDDAGVNMWASEVAVHKTVAGDQNVVQFYGAYFNDMSVKSHARCYIVMELCRESLEDFVNFRCQVEYEDVEKWTKDLCMGLRHIHSMSILHRDLKPANCMLQINPAGRLSLKICDFGNSCFLIGIGGKQLPKSRPLRPLLTTHRYASPEVCKKQPYSFPLDMWSVGVVLWEMLQEDARVPAVVLESSWESESKLVAAVTLFCNKVDTYRKSTKITTGMTQLAFKLLEVAPATRPTAQQVLDSFFTLQTTPMLCSPSVPMGLRGAESSVPMDLRGAEAKQELRLDKPGDHSLKVDEARQTDVVDPFLDMIQTDVVDHLLQSGGKTTQGQADLKSPMGIRGAGTLAESGETPIGIPGASTTDVIELAVRFNAYIDPPGDLAGFCQGARDLGAHQGNSLLCYILAQAKYPTLVKDLAQRFSRISGKLTAPKLKSRCWDAIHNAARLNDSPKVQQEMLIYDDQRMACVQGFPRIMQALRLLRTSDSGAQKGNTVYLGRGRPRLVYELSYDPDHLEKLVRRFGETVIGVDGDLTTEILLSTCEKARSLWRHGLVSDQESAPQKRPASSASHLKVLKKPSSASGGSQKVETTHLEVLKKPSSASGGSELAYLPLHYIRKHMYWLVWEHEQRETCHVDWASLTLGDLSKMMPDQAKHLEEIGNSVRVLEVAKVLQVSPMLISCKLCLTGRMLKTEHLKLLKDIGNTELLLRLKKEHIDKFGIPPSLMHLAVMCKRELSSASQRKADLDQEVKLPSVSGEANDEDGKLPSGSGEDFEEDKTLPSGSGEGKGKDDGDQKEEEEEEGGDGYAVWFPIPHKGKGAKLCQCKGNCLSRCPGRLHGCPNEATINLDSSMSRKPVKLVALCAACVCQMPECNIGARRPYRVKRKAPNDGQEVVVDYRKVCKNYGRCRGHWEKPL